MRTMFKYSFVAYLRRHFPNGETTTVHQVRGMTPGQQREAFDKAIVGYDPHHADAPGPEELKFL